MAFKAGMNSQNAECRRKIACYGFWFELVTALPWLFVSGIYILLWLGFIEKSEDWKGYDGSAIFWLFAGCVPVFFLWRAHSAPKGKKGEDRIWRITAGGISKAFLGSPFLTQAVLEGGYETLLEEKWEQLILFWTVAMFVTTCLYLRAGKIKIVIIAGLIREALQGFPSIFGSLWDTYVYWTEKYVSINNDGNLNGNNELVYETIEYRWSVTMNSFLSILVTCATSVILYKAYHQPKGQRKRHMLWAGILQIVLILKYLREVTFSDYHRDAREFVRDYHVSFFGKEFWNRSLSAKYLIFSTWSDSHWIFGACVFAFFWLSVSMGCCTDKFSLCCAADKTDSNDNGRVSVRIADKKSKKSNGKKAFK